MPFGKMRPAPPIHKHLRRMTEAFARCMFGSMILLPRAPRAVVLPTLAVLGLLVGPSPVLSPSWAGQVRDAEPAPAPLAAARGVVEGRVELRFPPPRRTPDRYGGRGTSAAARVQPVPAVVWLRGGPSGSGAPARAEMAQQDTSFVPPLVVVRVGGTVDFPNHDGFFHNVFSYSSGGRFDLGRYPQGDSKSVRLDDPGIVKVYCEVHQSMRGAILVAENGHHAIVGEDGSFRLAGVPPGRWTVVVWHTDLGSTEAEVTVPEDGTVTVALTLG